MSAVIESETRLVRAAKLREAMRLHHDKYRLVQQYRTAVRALKVNGDAMRRLLPERMERLEHRHGAFARSVSANLETLRTARDVSETWCAPCRPSCTRPMPTHPIQRRARSTSRPSRRP